MIKSQKQRLEDILLESEVITREEIEEALQVQKKKGGRLSRILIELDDRFSQRARIFRLDTNASLRCFNDGGGFTRGRTQEHRNTGRHDLTHFSGQCNASQKVVEKRH